MISEILIHDRLKPKPVKKLEVGMKRLLRFGGTFFLVSAFLLISACSKKEEAAQQQVERKKSDTSASLEKEKGAIKSTQKSFRKRETEMAKRGSKIQKGEKMRDFTARTVGGEEITFSEFQKDKYVLIDFWATWCRPCLREIPHLQEALKKHGDKSNFAILGVSLDKDAERVKNFVEKNKLNYPHLFDGKMWQNEVSMLYGVNAIPFTVLIDPEGKVIAVNLRGPGLTEYLDKHLES